jgi:nitrogen-specific signal transduction histidine kinase
LITVESATVLAILYGRFIEVWRQKEAIVQRNRMTRLLIQNTGHDVRTPLNSIINYLEVALEEELDERARLHLYTSLQASRSLVAVVTDLLNLTEAEEVDFHAHEDNVDLSVIIAEVVSAFKDETLRKSLKVHVAQDPSVPRLVRCDPSGLRQVLSNLVANAIQSSEAGNIYITLEHPRTIEADPLIKITIKDEGIGLSEQELDSIFQDFEQILDDGEALNAAGEEKPQSRPLGIGLGLAITARFVRVSSGQIRMSSEGHGKGTTVSITMPYQEALAGHFKKHHLSQDPSHPSASADALVALDRNVSSSPVKDFLTPVPQSWGAMPPLPTHEIRTNQPPFPAVSLAPGHKYLNILLAEDNPLNSRLLKTRLSRTGHNVTIAVHGQACFTLYETNPEAFDIVLMDIQVSRIFPASHRRGQ